MLEKKWWHEKVAYQIYPKSYLDTNGDGIGDLRGVINKLDYLKDLNVDILWLCPVYCSPMADQGYDISDYQNIDPSFGTMEDMDELLAEAKKRDMYIVMDLVVNHCSDEHVWFKKACEDPDGKYGKYFYIVDAPKDGSLPNNWRSYFGGSAWEKLPGHEDKLYFHAYHKKQPDLNWENPEVVDEVYKMINWWLEKGIAGFRIDAIVNISKPDIYQCFPADRADGMVSMQTAMDAATTLDKRLHDLKVNTFDKYNAFTVGEVFSNRPDAMEVFIGNNGHFSTMFDFSEARFGRSDAGWNQWQRHVFGEDYKKTAFQTQKELQDSTAYISNIIENHDSARGVSHYLPEGENSLEAKKMLGTVNFMLRGLPFIYQGQELGMTNVPFESVEEMDDCHTMDDYAVCIKLGYTKEEAMEVVRAFARDNCRTPFHWDDSENAGFTTGTPWLKVNPNYTEINAASQLNDPNSMYNWYKQMIALRKNPKYQQAVVYGDFLPYKEEQTNLMAYYRKGTDKTLLVVANYQKEPQDVTLPGAYENVLLNNYPEVNADGLTLHLSGYQVLVLDMKQE